ncbi:MAG TPA: hypothetical protein VNL14_03880 [Candidatus Acidoferrales bacterium]|nr:hypothetical protein [Candidatus Acidoferrales bacterium]
MLYDSESGALTIALTGDTMLFKRKAFYEAKLYPIDLGHGRPRAQRGRPVLADAAVAEKILDRLQRLSRRYGTAIEKEGTIGVIRAM